MKVATAKQMHDFDRRAAEEFGIPSIVLMENAGRHVFESACGILGRVIGKLVIVVAGSGNNGGDGFVAARHLRDAGAQVIVLLLAHPEKIKGDAKTNFEILRNTGADIRQISEASAVVSLLAQADLIIDAIFGTGIKGEVTGVPREIIKAINDSGRPVIAVDIPSGVDADTGRVLGVCVKADVTVTFALPKLGIVIYPGAEYAGRLVVGDIGIPKQLYDEVYIELTDAQDIAAKLPARPPNAHKGTFGTVVVIAGSAGLTGAAAMAGESALRVGAGLAVVGVPKSLQDVMAVKLTEVMTSGLPETPERSISTQALDAALELADKANAVVLGCGLGTHPETCEFVHAFIKALKKPAVIDADGLNALSKNTSVLESSHAEFILTPHPGEMARLLGTDIASIQSDRVGAAQTAALRFQSIVVLKGARTVIAHPNGRVLINPTGTSALATGGTGDVLAGAIGGLLAQGISPWDAAACGVYVHGRAGEIAERDVGSPGMLAGDVIRALPASLRELYALK
ncbi:MAG: NAD(P)H-hydrate dehydratase [Armatimonadota bacterium]|nr:NAD(P)H-hydrate dehydratase [Armatimonadota bacterium]